MTSDRTILLVLLLFQVSVLFNQQYPVQAVANNNNSPITYQGCLQKCQTFRDVACINYGLETIPNTTDCKRATILDLKRNRIRELHPGVFSGFSALEVLLLNWNGIRDIPLDVFKNLESLEALYFAGNNLTNLRRGVFAGLSGLNDRLILSENQITRLTTGVFGTLTRVVTVTLAGNLIESIEADTFEGMAMLTNLYLMNNHISRIVAGTFSGLGKLKFLDLSNNRIAILDNDAFEGLGNLEQLKLNSNHITSLAPIVSMPHLSTLKLADNEVKSLGDNQFLESKLQEQSFTITAQNNPLHCNCSNEPLRQWYMSHTDATDKATCETPEQYANRPLVDIQEPLQCHRELTTLSPSDAFNYAGNSDSIGYLNTTEYIVIIVIVGTVILFFGVILVIRRYRMKARQDELGNEEYQVQPQTHDEPPLSQQANGYSTYVNKDDTTQHALIDEGTNAPPPPNANGHVFQDMNPNETSTFLPQEGPYLSVDEVNQPLSSWESDKSKPPSSPPPAGSSFQDGPVCEIKVDMDGKLVITPGPLFTEEPFDGQDNGSVQYATLHHSKSSRDQAKEPRGYIAPRDLAKPIHVIST